MAAVLRCLTAAVLLLLAGGPAFALTDAEVQGLWDDASRTMTAGPSDIPFADQAVLHLPEEMAFIPTAQAAALMKSWGNNVGNGFRGMILSTRQDRRWVITIDQVAEGYVKDDDARNWNANDLLQSLKDGTEAQNKERAALGIPALDIVGWVEPPNYDSSRHRLVWSLEAVERGAKPDAEATVNYNTYALGRDGYYEINLLTGMSTVDSDKPIVQNVLSRFEYNDGKRYQDFNAETDHVAEYGIAALIAGVAAKKLGLLAIIGVFFAKFAKIILVGLAVIGGGIAKLVRSNRS